MKVLLLEADHAIRDLVHVAFRQFDQTSVDVAEDAWALEMAKEHKYDVYVVSDQLKEPGDGLRFAWQMRQDGAFGPLVVLARNEDATNAEKENLGITHVLKVPPDPVEIFECIVNLRDRQPSS